MKYYVVESTSWDYFMQMVQKHLDAGWTLQGGIAVSEARYYQAMIKVVK